MTTTDDDDDALMRILSIRLYMAKAGIQMNIYYLRYK